MNGKLRVTDLQTQDVREIFNAEGLFYVSWTDRLLNWISRDSRIKVYP
jgi:hypothetical protein